MKLKPSKIALFLPNNNSFYNSLFKAIEKGFAQCNVELIGMNTLLGEKELIEYCRSFNIQVVIEMNRSRSFVPGLPKSICHIAWIVDTLGYKPEHYKGSEILYFFGANWLQEYQLSEKGFCDWLPPGVDIDVYSYGELPHDSDFSFIGHLPLPWSKKELERIVYSDSNVTIRFAQVIEALNERLFNVDVKGYTNESYLQLSLDIISELTGYTVNIENRIMRYDLNCRTIRMFNRHRLMQLAVNVTDLIKIYGPSNWKQWNQYAPFYRGFLELPDDIKNVYQRSRLNLHEGVGPHFRAFDCLAAGGVLCYFASDDDSEFGGIKTLFDVDLHYVEVTKENFHDKTQQLLKDNDQRRKISHDGSIFTQEFHSWKVRAKKIIDDLYQI